MCTSTSVKIRSIMAVACSIFFIIFMVLLVLVILFLGTDISNSININPEEQYIQNLQSNITRVSVEIESLNQIKFTADIYEIINFGNYISDNIISNCNENIVCYMSCDLSIEKEYYIRIRNTNIFDVCYIELDISIFKKWDFMTGISICGAIFISLIGVFYYFVFRQKINVNDEDNMHMLQLM